MSLTHSQRSRLGAHGIAAMVAAMGPTLVGMTAIPREPELPAVDPRLLFSSRTGSGNLGRPPWVFGNPGTRQRKRRKYAASRRG